jgi:hypothetical protein
MAFDCKKQYYYYYYLIIQHLSSSLCNKHDCLVPGQIIKKFFFNVSIVPMN